MRYLQSTPPFPALPDARDAHDRPPPAPLLAAAVHAQSEGLLITGRRWNRSGLRIIFANESFCAMSGYTFAELRRRGHAFLHLDKEDLDRLQRWQTKLKPGMVLSGEGFLLRKDGARVYAAWNFSPVSDEYGHVTHVVATYRDLTEKRKLQDALVHSQRLDAVGRLAGGVAHDFNNLLSVINGYCEIMATKPGIRRRATRELEEIHQASQKAATLVRQLLAFSRQQTMNPKVVCLNQMIRENSAILSRLLKPRCTLILRIDPEPVNVRVDPAQLQQVLLNLSINGRDAMPNGGPLTISIARREFPAEGLPPVPDIRPGKYAVITVADAGIGMDNETRAHLFEPFFTTKEPGEGTGLGLALVYGVVQQSGGYVAVDSHPGQGSTFDIFIPQVFEPADPIAAPLPPLPEMNGRESLLIIEEDDVLRKMLASILTADGYTVEAEPTASKVARPVRQQTIDLAIVPVSPPADKEVETLLCDLVTVNPQLRVLGTASSECTPPDFIKADSSACLTKPYSLAALLKSVRALLDSRTAPSIAS